MAAKKKAKAGASARAGATKKKKAPAKKSKAKKPAKKAVKRPAKKPVKKSKKKASRKKPGLLARVIKAAKKAVTPAKPKKKKKKQVVGEGDYAATRKFDTDQAGFVKKNKARIPQMGKAAEAALDGPEGDSLRAAEAQAAGHSRDTFEP